MKQASSTVRNAQDRPHPVHLLICDDSIFMRMAIRTLCEEDPRIVVIGEARDGAEAIEAVRTLQPDVVTMDVDMPGVDGASATERIVRESEIPVIMLSGINRSRSALTDHLLECGAVDVIWKSASMMDIDIGGVAQTIIEKVLFWGQKPANPGPYPAGDPQDGAQAHDVVLLSLGDGGPHAVAAALGEPVAGTAPIIVAADIPMACMDGFMRRLGRVTGLPVTHVEDGTALHHDNIYVVPGTARLRLKREGDEMSFHPDPAAAPLSNNSAFSTTQVMLANAGMTALIVLLSGGRPTMQAMKLSAARGARILVQSPDTCVSSAGFAEVLADVESAKAATPGEIRRILGMR
ncbi:response regulator [Pikeienuella piscinae]|uniref:protein-glutamate methylesterase n=1 Tax=Pikeienuella piscinae TaxID=2748098 RepID=A0A7L5BXP1_9RHOB|nr:response regulator [Pikeienuella piscinae]QIE56695.1 response regulator [Pikeienuella piscinae]